MRLDWMQGTFTFKSFKHAQDINRNRSWRDARNINSAINVSTCARSNRKCALPRCWKHTFSNRSQILLECHDECAFRYSNWFHFQSASGILSCVHWELSCVHWEQWSISDSNSRAYCSSRMRRSSVCQRAQILVNKTSHKLPWTQANTFLYPRQSCTING